MEGYSSSNSRNNGNGFADVMGKEAPYGNGCRLGKSFLLGIYTLCGRSLPPGFQQVRAVKLSQLFVQPGETGWGQDSLLGAPCPQPTRSPPGTAALD